MADGYQIAINFSSSDLNTPGGSGGKGSSSDFLNQVLTRLSAAVDKLTNALNKQMFNFSNGGAGAGGSNGGNGVPNNNYQNKSEDSGLNISKTLSAAAIAAVAVTTVGWMRANANALMQISSNRGNFAGAGILGRANESFSSYVANYYDIEKNRQISRNNAIGESVGGLGGGIAGFFTSGLKGLITGASVGASAGDYATAALVNADFQKDILVKKARAERDAAVSTSEWQTGFSRFGLARTNKEIVSSDLSGGAPIGVHLSEAFEKRYGTVNGHDNPNYTNILNGIVPNLQSNPLDETKTGDLNKVALNFQKAGFAVSQFSELTIQGSQYQALTGKNLEKFSDELRSARSKFGDVYDISSNQTSLNLMAMGYSKNQAQEIAFQSKYNTGIAASASQFTSMSTPSYYAAKALSKTLGFDFLKTIETGQLQGDKKGVREELQKEIADYYAGKGIGEKLMILNSQGKDVGQVSRYLQPRVTPFKGAKDEKPDYSDAQKQATNDITESIKNALKNVESMTVNAANVYIYNSGSTKTPQQDLIHKASFMTSPLGTAATSIYQLIEGKRALNK